MTETTPTFDPTGLVADIADLERTGARVRVAQYGLASPIASMLAGQAQLEAYRAIDQARVDRELDGELAAVGRDSVADKIAEANRARTVAIAVGEETGRVAILPPILDDSSQAAIYGRVTDDGVPVEGATVTVVSNGDTLAFDCTGQAGDFALLLAAPSTVRVRVVGKDGTALHIDRDPNPISAGQRRFREIELTRVEVPCPPPGPPPPSDDDDPKMIAVPALVGRDEPTALKLLKTVGLSVGDRATKPDDAQVGLVLDQQPAAGALVEPDEQVSLVVAVRSKIAVPELVGLEGESADKVLQEVGLRSVRGAPVNVRPDKDGLVADQDPKAGAELDEGDQVRIRLGRGTPDALGSRIADAEKALREREVGVDRADGWLLERLDNAGARNPEQVDAVLSRDREELRDLFGVRTLRQVDQIRTEVRRSLRDDA